PRPRRGDRAYKGRIEDSRYHHDVIAPKEDTAAREAAMGPATLVVASATRETLEKAKRPLPARTAVAGDGAGSPARSAPAAASAPPAAPREQRPRPKPFAEDWRATPTERPPTTLAHPATATLPAPA